MQRRTVIWKRFARNRKSDKHNQQSMGVSTLDFYLDQECDLEANIPIVPIYHVLVLTTEHSWNIRTDDIWMK